MKFMGWSWQEYLDAPQELVDEIIDWVEESQD